MKALATFFVIGFSILAMAQTQPPNFPPQPPTPPPTPPANMIYVQGQGSAQGLCDGSSAVSRCFQALRTRAEQNGAADAQQNCWSRGGQGGGSSDCWSRCSPENLPAGSPAQSVRCQATCQASCLIP